MINKDSFLSSSGILSRLAAFFIIPTEAAACRKLPRISVSFKQPVGAGELAGKILSYYQGA
jgi:hypothetical protein